MSENRVNKSCFQLASLSPLGGGALSYQVTELDLPLLDWVCYRVQRQISFHVQFNVTSSRYSLCCKDALSFASLGFCARLDATCLQPRAWKAVFVVW